MKEEDNFAAEESVPAETPKKRKKRTGRPKTPLQNFLSWVLTILAAFLAALLINTYLIRTSMIYGRSMEPTLRERQVVMLSKLPYIFGDPAFGDVVVLDSFCFHEDYEPSGFVEHAADALKYNVISQKLFNMHDTEERYWIKRVIGIPGDTIEFRGDALYRNGEKLTESYINRKNAQGQEEDPVYDEMRNRYANSAVKIPEGYVFVMGDNRNNSKDSRMMGPVDVRAIIGKVLTGV